MALQTKTLAFLIAAIAVSAGLVGYFAATQGPSLFQAIADSTTTSTSPSTSSNWVGHQAPNGFFGGPQRSQWGSQWGPGQGGWHRGQSITNISSGTTITITSTSGKFIVLGSPSDNGTASGTLTFTVNSELSSGYVLTLTGGSITINGATYSVSSGSGQMNLLANGIQGQGTASSGSSFTIRAFASGNFSGTTTAQAMIDFKSGSMEYGVLLSGNISG
jgi:hypothetical protein